MSLQVLRLVWSGRPRASLSYRLLLVSSLGATLLGCDATTSRQQTPRYPVGADAAPPVADPDGGDGSAGDEVSQGGGESAAPRSNRPKRPRSTGPGAAMENPWAALPHDGAVGNLQPVYEQMVAALLRMSKELEVEKSSGARVDALARRRQVAEALRPVLGLLHETWARAIKQRPELREFESAQLERSKHAHMPVVGGATALGWFLVEHALDSLGTTDREFFARWTLNALRWSTSEEDVYETAFLALGPTFADLPKPMPETGPWRHQPGAIQAVAKAVAGGPTLPPNSARASVDGSTGVFGVDVVREGDAGHVAFVRASAVDSGGTYGNGNGQLDESELVTLAFEFQRAVEPGTLFSESLVPLEIPECVVVSSREVELSEVPKYGVATVALHTLVSGRCRGEQKLRVGVRSSNGPTTQVAVTLAPLGPPRVSLSLRRDSDLPGSSLEHDTSRGLVPGSAVELLPTIEAPGASKVALRGLGLARPEDSAFVRWAAPRFESTLAKAGGFVLEDDADLALAPESKLLDLLEGRERTSAFGSDGQGLWLSSVVETRRTASGTSETPTEAGAAGRIESANARRGGKSWEQAESWIRDHLPPGVDRDKALREAATAAAQAVKAVRAAFSTPGFLVPSLAGTQVPLRRLLENDLLDTRTTKEILARVELPTASLSKVVAAEVEKDGTSSEVVASLLDQLDARAEGALEGAAPVTDNDTARGIGFRIALSDKAARDLAAEMASSGARSSSARLRPGDHKLARRIIVADAATSALEAADARRVLSRLGVLDFDLGQAEAAVRRAVILARLMGRFGLDKAPDEKMARALAEFVGKLSELQDESASGEARRAVGETRLRRWVRLPIAVAHAERPVAEPPKVEVVPAPMPSPTPSAVPEPVSSEAPTPPPSQPESGEAPAPEPVIDIMPMPPAIRRCAFGVGPRVAGLGPMSFGSLGVTLRPADWCDLDLSATLGFQTLIGETLVFEKPGAPATGLATTVSTMLPLTVRGRYFLLGERHSLVAEAGLGGAFVLQQAADVWSRIGAVLLGNVGTGYGLRLGSDGAWRFSGTAGLVFAASLLGDRGTGVDASLDSLLLGALYEEGTFSIAPYGELSGAYLF